MLPIRLLVFDIDGVLTDGEARALDTRLLDRLANMNRGARKDRSHPAVTLCTGRPAPYVEVMLQAIDGHLPAIYENGGGLYLPETYRFVPHPELADQNNIDQIRQRLQQDLVDTGRAYFQPGKEHSLTLFPGNPADRDHLQAWATEALGPVVEDADLVYSALCLNVLPRGMHKGKGLQFMAEQTGYQFAEMLGVGDSDVDPPFLSLVGYSAAPSNATQEIKQMVQFVAPRPTADGVRDILKHFQIDW